MPEQPLHGTDRLETPERVDLDVDLAGVGSRTLAFLLDWIVLVLTSLSGSAALWAVASVPRLGTAAVVVWVIVIFVLWWLYFALFEALWDGQTPGKRLLGIRVRRVGGAPPGWPEVLIRNLLRILVDLVAFLIPVGLVLMLLTRRHQRIGDLAAGTVVIRERTDGILVLESMGFVRRDPAEPRRIGSGIDLSVEEFELLREFLARRDLLDREAAARIEERLARLLRGRLRARASLAGELESLPDGEFLARIDAGFRGEREGSDDRPIRGEGASWT
jgi:uncharacterized RDD family membrane protein YckC